MAKPMDSRRRDGRRWVWLLLVLQVSSVREALSLAGPAAPAVTEITLERDCFGCPTGSLLVLRRIGTSTFTLTGKARHGTVDRTSERVVPQPDFDELARYIVSQGFLELKEEYDDPELRDGERTITAVVRDGERRSVLNRNHAGPPSLEAIEKAIDAVRTRIGLVGGDSRGGQGR